MPAYDADERVDGSALASYGRTVMRGSLHTGLAQAVTIGCQILSVLILSRLLDAGDFGLVAMVGPVVAFVALFKEMGLLQAVVQKRDLTYGQVSSLFWINMGISAALTVLLVAAAPLIAAFYGDERLTAILRVMALNLALTAIGSQHFALMNRGLMFGRIGVNSSAVAVVTLGVSIAWAMVHPTPWALVAGTIAGSLAGAAMVWAWVPWRPARPAMARGTRALLGFGAGVTGFKLSNFFARNFDNVLIGRVWGGETLGFYDRAYKLLLFPLSRVADPLAKVMVPVLSRMQGEPARYEAAFFRVFGLMNLALLPGVATAAAMADTAVPFLLGEKWAAAAPIFAALGIAGLSQPLANPTGWLFLSQGRTTEMAWWGLGSALVTCAGFALTVQYGVVALAYGYAATSVIKLLPVWWLIGRRGPVGRGRIVNRVLPLVAGVALAYGAVALAQGALPGPAVARLALGAAIAYGAFAAVAASSAYGRTVLREVASLAGTGLRKLHARAARKEG